MRLVNLCNSNIFSIFALQYKGYGTGRVGHRHGGIELSRPNSAGVSDFC